MREQVIGKNELHDWVICTTTFGFDLPVFCDTSNGTLPMTEQTVDKEVEVLLSRVTVLAVEVVKVFVTNWFEINLNDSLLLISGLIFGDFRAGIWLSPSQNSFGKGRFFFGKGQVVFNGFVLSIEDALVRSAGSTSAWLSHPFWAPKVLTGFSCCSDVVSWFSKVTSSPFVLHSSQDTSNSSQNAGTSSTMQVSSSFSSANTWKLRTPIHW